MFLGLEPGVFIFLYSQAFLQNPKGNNKTFLFLMKAEINISSSLPSEAEVLGALNVTDLHENYKFGQ